MENWETEGRLNDNLTKTEGSVEKLKKIYSLQHFPCYIFFHHSRKLYEVKKGGKKNQ